jgi:hypothetical protein
MNYSQGKGFMMSRSFKIITGFLSLSITLLSLPSFGADPIYSVYDIKKTLPLHEREKVYRDYYVSMGTDAGVKMGSILAIYRRQGTVDQMHNENHDDLAVPIAHIKVIQAGKTMSVARLESLVPKKQIPVLEFNTVMLGDRAELTQAAIPETVSKRKVASAKKK